MAWDHRLRENAKWIGLFLFIGLILADAILAFYILRERINPEVFSPTHPTNIYIPAVMKESGSPAQEIPTEISVTATSEITKYRIQSGDTLFTIALKYDITVDDLVTANQIEDANRIYPGQELIIPLPHSAPDENP